jgi:hypothetical protein
MTTATQATQTETIDARLTAAKNRLDAAVAAAKNSSIELENRRDAAIVATIALRDLEFCITQSLLGRAHPRYPAAVEAKAAATAKLERARQVDAAAKEELESAEAALLQIEQTVRNEKRSAVANTRHPELVENLERAQADLLALKDRENQRGGRPASGRELYNAKARVQAAQEALDAALAGQTAA